jgi:hypothetical protein
MLAYLQDDAQYYFVIAENILRTGRSTFDGVTITTGYHPLWMLLDLALVRLGGLNWHVYVPLCVVVSGLLAAFLAIVVSALLESFCTSRTAIDVICVLVVARGAGIAFCGMESALAMPLLACCALATLRRLEAPECRPRDMLVLGLIAAATGLSRLDALPYGCAGAALVLWRHHRTLATTAVRGAAFAAGLLPFAVYLEINHVLTGQFLTTSARAKLLGAGLAWNGTIFEGLPLSQQVGFLYVPILGALLLLGPWSPVRGAPRQVAAIVLGFPLFYYGSIALRSSWQIWQWYHYPLPLAMGVSLATAVEFACRRFAWLGPWLEKRRVLSLGAVAAIIAATSWHNWRVLYNQGACDAAVALKSFSQTHPGRYAMGDRAGVTALMLSRSILQLEGLVADEALLESIRAERPLASTLSSYGVDYLVEAVPTPVLAKASCQEFTEPKKRQAGGSSPKMRGTFCDPLFRLDDPVDGYTTLVYDAHPGRAERRVD